MYRQNPEVELVERMLGLHKQLPKAKTPHEQESLKRTIVASDLAEIQHSLKELTE